MNDPRGSNAECALFREEVFRRQANRWLGEVSLIHPVPIKLIVTVSAVLVLVLSAFLASAAYTQRVRVEGILVPSTGVVTIVAPIAGTVQEVGFREGGLVERGQSLAVIVSEHATRAGDTLAEVKASIDERRAQLEGALGLAEQRESSQLADLGEKERSLRLTLQSLQRESKNASSRVALARTSRDKITKLRKDLLVSDIEVVRYEDDLLSRKSELSAIERQIITMGQELAGIAKERARLSNTLANERATLRGQLALLTQERVENSSRGEGVVTASTAGTVAVQLVEPGQVVSVAQPIARIVPLNSVLEAHFLVPSRVVGLLAKGQSVQMAYNAFPYQKYGLYRGMVANVTLSPVPGQASEELYRAVVQIDQQYVSVDGKRFLLKPGMQMEADIMLERSNLLASLIAPFKSFVNQLP